MLDQLSTIDQAKNTLIDLAIRFGPKVLAAIVILVAGFYAGNWIGKGLDRWLGRLQLEPPVRMLLVRTARLIILGLFLIMALQNLGVDLLPLIAGISVVGAGVALAMQGVLGNLAAGLTIIFTRPFRVGEYISVVGVEGRVTAVELFSTTLSHSDMSIVVIPNRKIVGEILHNYGQIRQLNLNVAISRANDLERSLEAIRQVVADNALVLPTPAASIGVASLGERTIGIAVKPWVRVTDYVAAAAQINRGIVEKLSDAGVSYPSSQFGVIAGGAV